VSTRSADDEEQSHDGDMPRMTGDPQERIQTILVPAGRGTSVAAEATIRSIESAGIAARPVVLATASVADRFAGYEVFSPTSVLPPESVAVEVLEDKDLLAFTEPFAMALCLERYGSVASVASGCTIVGEMVALEREMMTKSMVLAISAVVPSPDTAVPHLALRDSREVFSAVVVGARSGAEVHLRAWQQTMIETLYDPGVGLPGEFRDAALASMVGRTGVGVEGVGTVISWADWAAMRSRGLSAEAIPPVVESAELWDMLTFSDEREEGDMTEMEYRLVGLRLHDASPLEPLIDIMMTALTRESEPGPITPYERLVRSIRRASDPGGIRWPIGAEDEFEAWLFEANGRGTTRIADMFWYANPDLVERFPDARVNPAPYLSWCRDEGTTLLGFDLLDRRFRATHPTSMVARANTGWRHAVAWRWNIAKTLIPGFASASKRRDLGLSVVSGPDSARGVNPPVRIRTSRDPSPWGDAPRLLTLVGCLRAESGLGQASRASLSAIQSLEIPFSYIDTSEMYPSRNVADVGLNRSTFGAAGDVNLIHANANEILKLNDSVLRHRLGGRFNAAMWFWEAGNLPAWQIGAFDRIDELWVASSYLVDVFGQYGRVPVHNIGLATQLPSGSASSREALGFRDDEFVFLFVYDALSSHGRKNPELALKAFIAAFGPSFDRVRFIIKASNLNKLPVDRDRLMRIAATTNAITVIDRYLDHDVVYDLMATADVYVSLHAAEGYGLTILEAMSLGTPAISTAYSGSMDFTTAENSWLIDYELIRTKEIAGPYPIGSIWAKPDLQAVVETMRHVATHPQDVSKKAEVAKVDAREAASLSRFATNLGVHLRRVL